MSNIIHILFEVVENTPIGIYFINQYLWFWPGGKPYPDSLINSAGDVFSGAVGWLVAYYLDRKGTMMGWYSPHLPIAATRQN